MILFNRVYSLSVGAPIREPNDPVTGQPGRVVSRETRTWDKLYINFSFEKTMDASANKGSISIYNLSDNSISFIKDAQGEAKVDLEIGYLGRGDGVRGILCRGDIISVAVNRTRPDKVTVLEVGEGQTNLNDGRVAKTYKTGTPWRDALMNGISSMQVNLSNNMKTFINDSFMDAMPESFQAAGPIKDIITKITQRFGFSWSIQNDEFIINEYQNPNDALTLDYNSGLLNEPQEKDNTSLSIRALLDPRLVPGRIIQLQGTRFDGLWQLQKGKYSGDNFTGDWFVDGELLRV